MKIQFSIIGRSTCQQARYPSTSGDLPAQELLQLMISGGISLFPLCFGWIQHRPIYKPVLMHDVVTLYLKPSPMVLLFSSWLSLTESFLQFQLFSLGHLPHPSSFFWGGYWCDSPWSSKAVSGVWASWFCPCGWVVAATFFQVVQCDNWSTRKWSAKDWWTWRSKGCVFRYQLGELTFTPCPSAYFYEEELYLFCVLLLTLHGFLVRVMFLSFYEAWILSFVCFVFSFWENISHSTCEKFCRWVAWSKPVSCFNRLHWCISCSPLT